MRSCESKVSSRENRARNEFLSVALMALMSLPPIGFAAERGKASPSAGLASIVVNTTGDGDNLDANVGCDTDAGTPGEQCSLRAAIQRANTLAGDDAITLDIPASEPNCDATTLKCIINLTKALDNPNTNMLIDGPGAELLTVRRNTGGNYRIFTIAGSATVTLSNITIENGDAGATNGGGVFNAGSGQVTILQSVVQGNGALNGGGINNDSSGSVNVVSSVVHDNTSTNGAGGIFNRSNGTVRVTDSLVQSNHADGISGNGGGINNNSNGTVRVTRSTIDGNITNGSNSDGGGIYNGGTGTVDVTNSLIGNNLTGKDGGGINNASTGTVNVINSSVFLNKSVNGTGGGIRNVGAGALNISNSTFFQNIVKLGISGGGINGSATVKSTIIAGSFDDGIFNPVTDVEGSFTSAGFNFVGDKGTSTGFTQPTDQTGTSAAPLDPELIIIPQSPTFGLTNGILVPRCGSPVVDKATSTPLSGPALTTDLRGAGFPRTVDEPSVPDATGGDGTDTGAFERPVCTTLTLTVNTTADTDDLSPGDSLCDTDAASGAQCTLRAAISETNALTGAHTIVFDIPAADPSFNPNTSMFTINLTGALPDITTDLNLNGPGPGLLTVRRGSGGPYRIFNFTGSAPVDASISGLTISNGLSTSQGGGIFFSNKGSLTVTDCLIADNTAERSGGGIVSNDGTVNVADSTFTNNFAFAFGNIGDGGGAVFTGSSQANVNVTFNITNSTFVGNGTGGTGGAILGSGGELNITNSTITGNTVSGGVSSSAGGLTAGGVVRVKSSIIALNIANSQARDVNGAVTSGGFNLIGNASGSTGFTQSTDQTGLDPKLDPAGLQNNGGPTRTIALLMGSPAIDKGTANGLTGLLTTDQRGPGFARTFDDPSVTNAADGTDIGAFELNPAAPSPTPTPTPTPSPSPTAPTFQFELATYPIEEGCAAVNVQVLRSGSLGSAASVDLASEDGTAKQKGDYTLVVGHLLFAPGEAEKTFQVLINDDSYVEGLEFATLLLQHPINGTLGASSTATIQIADDISETGSNPIDESEIFVCTHYHDFLYRQSDQLGEDFWTQQIEQCGPNIVCRQAKRIDVSTAFFLSTEFQQTGYFVIRAHKAAFGDLKSNPRYEVFLRDQREIGDGVIVGQPGFEQQLDANRQKYLEDFVSRPEFVALFPQGTAASAYVTLLFANAGASPTQSERDAAIAAYGSGNTAGRAVALKSVVESGSVFNAQYNPAFVLLQYYGYLRRNPDDAPDNNFSGYDFWLAKMNSFTLPGEDARNESVALARVRRAEMVKAFIESIEYRSRFFGAPEGNQQAPKGF